MTDQTNIGIIIRTKLHRPPAPGDYVHRTRLSEYLDQQLERPLTLVSAPAGYGKSTLVSCWLDRCDQPSAWISLDRNDNDLRQFLSYFIAAVKTICPNAVNAASTLVDAPTLPPLSTLVGTLANELDAIEQNFILVLDDIHCIQEQSVHHFLKDLLRHPPQPMHLVLIGRRDPLLSIAALRARSQLAEIRLQDLRFTAAETAAYLQQIMKMQIADDLAVTWTEKTEGWVSGLRLAALSIQHRGDLKTIPPEFKGGTQYVMEYLFSEVLARQPPDLRAGLIKTSILDRFCAPLYDAMVETGVVPGDTQNDAWQFITQLKKKNLFLIGLDAEGQWFRYHHLFQNLLKRQLQRNYSAGDINTLHAAASEWFESQGLITESIKHALAAEDHVRAAEIVERHRPNEFNADRWYVVEGWLAMLPPEVKRQRPSLLMTDGWVAYCRLQLERIPVLIQQCEAAVGDRTLETEQTGELEFFRGSIAYWTGEAEKSRRHLEEARSILGSKERYVESETELALGLARCMTGDKELAVTALEDRIRGTNTQKGVYLAKLIGGLVLIHLLSGDLARAITEGKRFRRVAAANRLQNHEAWSDYLEGCAHLQTNQLDVASRLFSGAIERRYILETRAVLDAFSGLALAQQLMQQSDNAQETEDQLQRFANELNDPMAQTIADSCAARLSVLRGNPSFAESWSRSFTEEPAPDSLFMWLEAPLITQARCFIAEGSKRSLKAATESLRNLKRQSEEWCFTGQIIEIAVLKALALKKQGRADEALDALKDTVALAESSGWIRPFIEAGQMMADLLMRLRQQNVSVDYIERILAAFPDTASTTPLPDLRSTNDKREFEAETVAQSPESKNQNSLIEPLTHRELDILELLAQRLQNKEIAQKLFISPTTVKTHLKNIYQKLNVSKRLEAVERAKKIGIL
jgi:LuxR family maltose regulon positive regulatory protein